MEVAFRDGKVRFVFVADEIPSELRRIVEFLNQQMDSTEVLAVEVKQYTGGGDMTTLVPRVVGQTAEVEHKKRGGVTRGKRWDEASFFAELERREAQERPGSREGYSPGRGSGCPISTGVGAKQTDRSSRAWITEEMGNLRLPHREAPLRAPKAYFRPVRARFVEARRRLRRHYQHIVLHDFLRNIVDPRIVDDLIENELSTFSKGTRPRCQVLNAIVSTPAVQQPCSNPSKSPEMLRKAS